ncbi:hypothetical protein [Weissella cibaria]|uniref:DUF1617 family protein n=1 Tax=Weissella cibaria TaxID=137591 RepID=A0A0D1LXF5_9LACO|nr:hypothetical protein [Weissella cibaria]KIU23167.1 hypothetical protein ab3b_01581 [Weissella cibaria]
MKLKNYQIYMIGNYLQSLTLPAQVSRAKSKLIAKMNDVLRDQHDDEQELLNQFNATKTDQGWDFGTVENKQAYEVELDKLKSEIVVISISEYPTLEQALKDYFKTYDGDIAPEYADVFDAFYDALEIEENEEN